MTDELYLGFLEASDEWRLESRYFRSKVGGRPAWLSLRGLPSFVDRQCAICQGPTLLLCQLYAPQDDPHTFHRTLFVLMCPKPSCHASSTDPRTTPFRVFRSQLSRRNEFYPPDPPEEDKAWRTDIQVEKYAKVCRVCGCAADKDCGGCRRVAYCCRDHQTLDWRSGHKLECKDQDFDPKASQSKSKILLPEFEIVNEVGEEADLDKDLSDDEDEDGDDDEDEEKRLNDLKELETSGKIGNFEANEVQQYVEGAEKNEDKMLLKFKKVVENSCHQVIRYWKDQEPLLISSQSPPNNIPDCEVCGSKRTFEFQVMPYLLVALKLDQIGESVDFGTLLVYTCQKNCDDGPVYKSEYLHRQNCS